MKGIASRISLLCLVIALAAVLAGCDHYEPDSTEDQARDYYQQKYGVSAEVVESNGLGNYDLFGYRYGGMEYIMSDGASVVYIDDDGVFRDNRQTEELQPLVTEFALDKIGEVSGALSVAEVETVGMQVGYETYKGAGACWHERYDGDLEEFLLAERPDISLASHYMHADAYEGSFFYDVAYEPARKDALGEAYRDLWRYFRFMGLRLAVIEPEAAGRDDLSLFDDELICTIEFRENPDGSVDVLEHKPVFVPLADGITVSSATAGVTLRPGDVTLEPAGEGFVECHLSGEVARAKDEGRSVEFIIWNDGPSDLVYLNGIDEISPVCEHGEHRGYCSLYEGETYYLGDKAVISPKVEIESVEPGRVVARYRTYFKDQVDRVSVRVIAMASEDGGSYQSSLFESRIIGEFEDGWLMEVDVPADAKPDNTFYFQLTYNGAADISVQIEQDVQLP